jgi:hypothetical protein
MTKIEVNVDFLKQLNLPQEVFNKIIKDSNPDYWITKLPDSGKSPRICNKIITLEDELFSPNQTKIEHSFFSHEDAEFIREKCDLLIEMSNFAFIKNSNWQADWNDKEQKKYGIILKDGITNVNENDVFNLYVFGIALKNRVLALEMLDEFKIRIEKYFNKQFNSFKNFDIEDDFDYEIKHVKNKSFLSTDFLENNEKKITSKIKPQDYDKLIRLVSIEKKSINELCEEFKVSRGCIENVCLKLNLDVQNIRNTKKISKEDLENLINKDYTVKSMAQHFNCCESKIHNLKKQYELTSNCGYNSINKEEFIENCKNYNNSKEERNKIMKKFNIKTIGAFYNLRKKLIS